MGFPAEKARLALEHAGGGQHEEEAVLEWLVAHQETDLDALSTDIEGFSSSWSEGVDLADFDDDEGLGAELTEKDKKFLYLVEMGFAEDEISSAMNTCGEHEPVGVLADAIYAAQISRRGEGYDKNIADVELSTDEAIETSGSVKRKYVAGPSADKGRPHNKQLGQVDMAFGSGPIYNRKIPDIAKGPPYFYFESMAYALQGVGDESGFLHDIQPEFIDTKDFCAVTQTRRCIHNLPTLGRFHITPAQPRTIHEVFPQTMMWWPPWDNRTQLNCIRTKTAPAAVFKNVRFALTNHLNEFGRRRILDECMEWNLIWVGPKTVAALEPGEVELVLGLPRDHTRGFSMTDRYRALGNSVQVDTLAYHLSVLGERFPSGIRVLSLFSGIGGAEIALNRLGIQLNVVVSAELCKMNQNIMRSWWDQSKQTGELIQVDDIQKLKGDYLETLVRRFGGFDLVIGGSLEQPGQFCRCSHILAQVKQIMRRM